MNPFYNRYITSLLKFYNCSRSVFYRHAPSVAPFKPLNGKILKFYQHNRPYGPLPRLCYAPWTNLFFNTYGHALTCCKNTKVVLGSYPESSVSDIWFSNKNADLKKHLLHNDLSSGCYKCHEALSQKSISATTAVYFDKYGLLPMQKYPRVIEFELSNCCNLECVMCSGRVSSQIQKNREQQPAIAMPYDSIFVKQLEPFIPHLSEAKFYGGEPFLINIYYEIWDLIFTLNPAVKIFAQTNATILNDKIKSILRRQRFEVSVSLDSLDKNIYEKIRKNASFENTMSNIDWFGAQQKNMTVIATPFRLNWKEIPDIVRYCNKNKYIFNVSPVYHPEHLALWSLGKEELEAISGFYASADIPQQSWLQKKNAAVFSELQQAVKYWVLCKESQNDFNAFYAGYMASNETPEKEKISVTAKDIEKAVLLFNNTVKQHGITDETLNWFTVYIDTFKTPQDYPFPKRIVFHYLLKIHSAEALVNLYKTSSREQFRQRIASAFDKIQDMYSYDNRAE